MSPPGPEQGRHESYRRPGADEAAAEAAPDTAPAPGTDDDVLDPHPVATEHDDEATLRPRTLDEFVGQSALKEQLAVTLGAAKARSQPPDHLLFAGPPGLGKTSLAGIVAAELETNVVITSGPAVERAGDLAAILTNLGPGDVLFVDEIHRLPKVVEEVLYPAMEDFKLDIVLGKGPAARSIRLDLPRFTLVGATTRTGLIAGPLRDRFGLVERLDYYDEPELRQIVLRAARILAVDIDEAGAAQIAARSRGTPRIANRLLRRVRDFAEVRGDGHIDAETADNGLTMFGVDSLGLDKVDRAILSALTVTHAGHAVGLSTLSIAVGEQPDTVEEVYEPFLIQKGLLRRTPRGRTATAQAYEHLGLEAPANSSDELSLGM
ncbi:MAG TPA: Holliday junction branch migration DNA helicase RuvB [Acidimicrobiaceae bacterium]|nr:Holliday junction branch migration DNA helicase RuvB [Acidimicrobiaceae bacterium]